MLVSLIVFGAIILLLIGWSGVIASKAEQLVPRDGELLDVGGACVHYLDLGPKDAQPIVMIHGLLGQMRHFTYALAERMARDHRVIVIDRPGWGYSIARPHPDVAAQADLIAAFIEKLGLEKPWLVGHSMGGAVSLAVAVAHPEAIKGAALIAPLTQPVERPPEPFKSLVVPPVLRGPLAWTLATPLAMLTGKTKSAQVFHPDPVPADFLSRGGGALGVRPKSFRAATAEMGFARQAMETQAPRYGEIKVPVAILYGREDSLLDPELHGTDTATAIPGATIEIVEGGHMLPVTQPELTEAWLRRVSGS
jgi:pimeloyl-ACP methyl ester carboxylesterase